jgi:uncharacterized protein with HEPN domain
MLKRVDSLLIADMIVAIEEINNFIEGDNYETFTGDAKTKAAVVRNLEIIGEAASMISEETKLLYPLVEWKEMKSLRNKLIHDYFGIDFSIVWNIIKDEIQYNYHLLKQITFN